MQQNNQNNSDNKNSNKKRNRLFTSDVFSEKLGVNFPSIIKMIIFFGLLIITHWLDSDIITTLIIFVALVFFHLFHSFTKKIFKYIFLIIGIIISIIAGIRFIDILITPQPQNYKQEFIQQLDDPINKALIILVTNDIEVNPDTIQPLNCEFWISTFNSMQSLHIGVKLVSPIFFSVRITSNMPGADSLVTTTFFRLNKRINGDSLFIPVDVSYPQLLPFSKIRDLQAMIFEPRITQQNIQTLKEACFVVNGWVVAKCVVKDAYWNFDPEQRLGRPTDSDPHMRIPNPLWQIDLHNLNPVRIYNPLSRRE